MNSAKYEAALQANNEAQAIFDKAREDYRAMLIDDAEYLLARAVWNYALAIFDAAYLEEQA